MQRWVRAAVLSNYFEVARLVGLKPGRLLKQAGLSPVLLSDPDRKILLRSALDLLENSATSAGHDTFGLRMAHLRKLSDFGAVSLLLIHQPTLRAALTILQRYQYLLNQSLSIHVEEHDGVAIIREEFVAEYRSHARQGIELALGVLFRMCDMLFGSGWKPTEAHFTHAAPTSRLLHREVFSCTLCFGSEFNGFVCSPGDLDRSNARVNPEMARYAENYLKSLPGSHKLSIQEQVRHALHFLSPTGHSSAPEVARHLGINVRSMQRQLEREGFAFLAILHEVRQELATRYLGDPGYSIVEVAELLGYSTPSAFSRWFTGQFGISPRSWRAARLNKAAP